MTDSLLPRHHVRESRPILSWLICIAALIFAVASIAFSYNFWRLERERVIAFFAAQHAAQQDAKEKITVTYEDGGIVCTVPAGQERAAAVVFQGCNALSGALKAAGVIK